MRLLQSHLFGVLAIVAGVVSTSSESGAALNVHRKLAIAAVTPISAIAAATSNSAAPTALTWSDGFYGIPLDPETITATITTTGGAQPAATTITTDYTSTLGTSHPVFTASTSQAFMFFLNPGYTINTAALLLSSSSTLAEGAPPPSATSGTGIRRMAERDSERRSEPHFETTLSLGHTGELYSITINSTEIISHRLQLMCFRLEWTDDNGAIGYTYSSNITYVADSMDLKELSSVLPLLPSLNAAQQAYSASFISQTSAATATGTTGTALTTPASTTASATASGSSTASSSASDQSRGKNGISGGAIAGIVVGVIAVLVLAGLAIFLLRRRRRSSAGGLSGSAGAYRGSGSEQIGLQSGFSSAAVVEKDSFGGGSSGGGAHHGGAHSPYTDDDGVARAGPRALPTAAAGHADANYSTPAPPALVPAKQPTAAAAASATPPKPAVSGQVAALIEAGMTPDDVARLAAEEEELDLAIAKAHRSRQTSQA